MKVAYTFILFNLLFFSTYSQMTPEEYASKYNNIAIKNMKESGIPASITLAQGILESASGNSYLAISGNNHFGIKCHGWTGKKIYHDDDARNECFRKYDNVYESFKDHANFLRTRNRYSFLFDLNTTDYKGWAHGLSKAGYATDPQYPQKLISLIERYQLYIYDSEDFIAAQKPTTKKNQEYKKISFSDKENFTIKYDYYQIYSNNNVPYVYAKKGDNIDNLSENLNLMLWQIRRYNDLDKKSQINEGDIIYTKPKRRRAQRKHQNHIVGKNETMHEISQTYAIRLNRLYRLNNIEIGTEVKEGTKLNLRKRKR